MLLVIEDDEGVQQLARLMLGHAGYEVLLAGDGQQGVELFHQHAAEVQGILLDLTLPVLSGLQALRRIREEQPDVPVLLMSGYTDQDLPREYRTQPSIAFVQKPFIPSELLSVLQRLLMRASSHSGGCPSGDGVQ